MPALETGVKAPDIRLPLSKGGSFSLAEALRRGPVVAAFFKISCPVCQMALPYLERIFRAYPADKVTFVGVSQNDRKGIEAFAREYGLTFPLALDDTSRYPVSNAYGITHVPTIFFIAPDGQVELSSVGWAKQDIGELNRRVAQAAGAKPKALFHPGEDVPAFKAG